MKDLISIIVPVYKVEKYLRRCIQSIICQTYSNIEIILVDDGSPDRCGEICDEYAEMDNRIKVIHKDNGGQATARNAGLDIAKGEYISFVDSDDYISENMIQTLYNRIVKDSSDMAVCGYTYVDENDSTHKYEKRNSSVPICDEIIDSKRFFEYLTRKKYSCYVVPWNKLYRRELFDNLRYKSVRIYEDEYIIHHIVGRCNVISCINTPLYMYVQRSGSTMCREYSIQNLVFVEALMDRTVYALENGYNRLAENSFYSVVGKLMIAYKKLDKSDDNVRIRLKEFKKNYNKLYRLMIRRNMSLSVKLKSTLAVISPRLYNIIRKNG